MNRGAALQGPLRIYTSCFRECLARLVWPTLILAALTTWIAAEPGGGSGDPRIDRTATWLHLPAMLLSAVTIGAVLDAWPLFSRDRPGAALLERLPNGLLDGCAMASLGGMTALGLVLALIGSAFDLWMFEPPHRAQRRIEARVPARAELRVAGDELRLALPEASELRAVVLHPRAFYPEPGVFDPVALEVWLDGTLAAADRQPTVLRGLGERTTVRFAPRSVTEVTVRRVGSSGPRLAFGAGSVVALRADDRSSVLNAVLAGCSYLIPVALALAAACVFRAHLILGVALGLGLAILLLSTVTGFAPTAEAVRAYAGGYWIPDEGVLGGSFLSLSTVVLAMLLAVWAGKQRGT